MHHGISEGEGQGYFNLVCVVCFFVCSYTKHKNYTQNLGHIFQEVGFTRDSIFLNDVLDLDLVCDFL